MPAQIWAKVTKVTQPESGAGGVFFARFDDDSISVVKGSSTLAQQAFAMLLAQKLKLRIPTFRIISYENQEWKDLKRNIIKLAKEDGIGVNAEIELNRPVFMIMEFVKGKDLAHIKSREELDEGSLREIGKFIAFDIFVNNWDRLPVIWDNEGNLSNMLISDSTVIGIDENITCIHPTVNKIGFEKYLQKCTDLLNVLKEKPNEESTQLKSVRDSFMMMTGVDFGEKDSVVIQQGIIEGVKKCR
eukprot:TRINITY_DN7707_c0_g1_i1.p1 TRINITY_DN7707_c0_g1~~TRINITY_DN7707_c0_g1_i1.p1  ORF type:complete len:244 (-),score=63.56 TRINITY_DN7707_c0_g1_i1:158-889(-)